MLTRVKINSIDVTPTLVSYEYERTYGDLLSEVNLKFVFGISSLVTVTAGQTLEIWRGWVTPIDEKVFSGYVEKFEPDGGLMSITGIDKLWDAVRKEVTKNYQTVIGTNSGTAANKLIDSSAKFKTGQTPVNVGDYVSNTTDSTNTTVSALDSETQLSLTADIFAATPKGYAISLSATLGKISSIFKDLIVTYAGLTADNISVQDSGSVYLLSRFVCNHTDPFERCKALSTALNWQFYYRADTDKVYFEPKGFTINATVLIVGDNIIGVPKWNIDVTETVNDLTVNGAVQLVETTEPAAPPGIIGTTAGYTANYINLSFEPISVKLYADAVAGTTLRTGGNPGVSIPYFYSINTNNKRILPADGTTFTAGWKFIINYSYYAPNPVHMTVPTSISIYGTFKKTLSFTDIKTIEDAETRARNYLSDYSDPFVYTTIKVKNVSTYGLAVGQKIRIVDNLNTPPVDGYYVINKHRIRYPADYDELDVGDKYWKIAGFNANVLESIKRLNEQSSTSSIISHVLDIDNDNFSPINLIPRYRLVYTNTFAGDGSLIFGHPTFGIIGTYKFGAGGMGASTNRSIQQYQDDYSETFYDTDFDDAGVTTATWNTAAKQLVFAAGQIAQSLSIDYNNTTITTATITVIPAYMRILETAHYVLNTDASDLRGIYNGVVTGATFSSGKIGSAAYFDGTINQYITIADAAGLRPSAMSIAFWIWPTNSTPAVQEFVINKGWANVKSWAIIHDVNGKVQFVVQNAAGNSYYSQTDNNVGAAQWTHIVGWFDGTNVKLYKNGIIQARVDAVAGADFLQDTSDIKMSMSGGTHAFPGRLDDIRIFDYAIGASVISALYNSGTGTELGTSTLYLSADGGANWETAYHGLLHRFSNTGTDLRWKIIPNPGTITYINITDYH